MPFELLTHSEAIAVHTPGIITSETREKKFAAMPAAATFAVSCSYSNLGNPSSTHEGTVSYCNLRVKVVWDKVIPKASESTFHLLL